MKTNHVKAKLKRGEASIGTWLSIPDPTTATLMAQVGFDWLNLNIEHMPIGVETASLCYSAIASTHTVPLARPAWNTGENIKRVLDNGGWGVILPMVCTREDADLAVDATFYAPLGSRSVGGMLHAVSFQTDPATYYERANEEILLVLQLEHIKAIENAEKLGFKDGQIRCTRVLDSVLSSWKMMRRCGDQSAMFARGRAGDRQTFLSLSTDVSGA